MVGKRRTPEQPCFSVVYSNKLWPHISDGKTQQLLCTASGPFIRSNRCTTRSGTAGTACCSKGFSCSIASVRKTVSAFASPGVTCRSSSRGRSQAAMTSSPMWMPSDSSDDRGCLLEWKTTSSRYPKEPEGLLALDPQLVCYSWITGISDVAQIVFVRKRLVEIQYLRTTITDAQRQEFGQLVRDTIQHIESAQFLPHSGIRFPQNPCSSCPYVGLCLGKQELAAASLVRRPGAQDFGWLDELNY